MPSGSYADRLRSARVYLVLEAAAADSVEPALRGGVDLVQLRDKEAGDDEIVSAGRKLRALCAEHGALFLVNDRPDLAVACAADVDYYAVGPVFETPTKEGRPATGWDLIAYAAGRATKPWFAIGGMDPETARAAAAAGARRVVVVRAIRDADDPEAAARAGRAALDAEERVGAA